MVKNSIGFGDEAAKIKVYIGNKPNMFEYQQLSQCLPLASGEINAIGQMCGNGWRKVFNVYAKLLYALDPKYFPFSNKADTWQNFRDCCLLQQDSDTALLFSSPNFKDNDTIHIVCGRTYAKQILAQYDVTVQWLDDAFAIDKVNNLVICPYFDYRQLSNIKIERLAALIKSLKSH